LSGRALKSVSDPNRASGSSPGSSFHFPAITPRGMRIEAAASYSGLSPFYIEQLIRDGQLPALGGPGSGVCAAYVVLREHLDQYLDELREQATERAAQRRKERAA
jgi:hypothetical protein